MCVYWKWTPYGALLLPYRNSYFDSIWLLEWVFMKIEVFLSFPCLLKWISTPVSESACLAYQIMTEKFYDFIQPSVCHKQKEVLM